MSLTYTSDLGEVITQWAEGMERRTTRAVILPAMKEAWQPVIGIEQANINSISGTLAMSLKARSGGSDWPGITSVFTPPAATPLQVARKWSKSPKRQHHKFAARALQSSSRRYRVFYGPWVESGHAIKYRNKFGELIDTGKRADPHPFAAPAMEAGSESAMQNAEEAILQIILGD
jgi:hypothetical protein